MTTIRRQSIFSLIFIYAGFLIGALNILFLFPRYFSMAEFGLTRLLLELALLLSTLCTLGMVPVSIKFFPFHKRYLPDRKNDLLFVTLAITLVGLALMLLLLPAVKPLVIRKFGYRSPLFVEYFDLIYPLTIGMTLFSLYEGYAWIIGKTVTSNFLKEFLFRGLTTVLIMAFVWGWISDFDRFIRLFSWTYLPPLLLLIYFVWQSRQFPLHPSISPVTRRLGGKMAGFGVALFASSTLNALAKTNDSIILASQSTQGLADTGVYSIATYLITLMEVPQRSLTSAAAPQIAIAWGERNMPRLLSIYRKTALNLLIIGMALLGLILLNVEELIEFLGKMQGDSGGLAAISMLVLILGIAKIIDMGTGMNAHILMLSKHWKIDLFSNMFFVAVSFVLNYLLTKKYGITGPAFGTLIAICFFNLIRFVAIWKIYHLQPFSIANVKVVAIALLSLVLAWLVPDTGNLYLDVALASSVFIVLFVLMIIRLRVSADVNELYEGLLKRFSGFKY